MNDLPNDLYNDFIGKLTDVYQESINRKINDSILEKIEELHPTISNFENSWNLDSDIDTSDPDVANLIIRVRSLLRFNSNKDDLDKVLDDINSKFEVKIQNPNLTMSKMKMTLVKDLDPNATLGTICAKSYNGAYQLYVKTPSGWSEIVTPSAV